MIAADMAFHQFIYALSENPLIAPVMETHWTYTQRVMGEVLMQGEKPRDIWNQHEAMLEAIAAGDAQKAENIARQHILQAADFMVERLRDDAGSNEAALPDDRIKSNRTNIPGSPATGIRPLTRS